LTKIILPVANTTLVKGHDINLQGITSEDITKVYIIYITNGISYNHSNSQGE